MTAVSNDLALWWIVIGISAVVTLCVVILLSLLAAFVGDIDRHVGATAVQLQHVLTNTDTYPEVYETARLVGALGAELQEHNRALASKAGPL